MKLSPVFHLPIDILADNTLPTRLIASASVLLLSALILEVA